MFTKINRILFAVCMVFGLAACEIDNYDEPEAGLQGTIIDSTTGLPLQTAPGKQSMQIRIWETSFAKERFVHLRGSARLEHASGWHILQQQALCWRV